MVDIKKRISINFYWVFLLIALFMKYVLGEPSSVFKTNLKGELNENFVIKFLKFFSLKILIIGGKIPIILKNTGKLVNLDKAAARYK